MLKSIWSAYSVGSGRGCDDRLLGAGSGPAPPTIYFCFEGGSKMRTPSETIEIKPGTFVVHPRGELHEYGNGPQRTLLFRVRYGEEMSGRTKAWPSNVDWGPRPEDLAYFR